MIQVQTYLNVADNTGAKKLMCIRVLGTKKKYAKVGDCFVGVVKDALPNMPIKRSAIVKAVVIRTKRTIKRADGTAIRFQDNAAVIINSDKSPRGTRIFGPVAREVRERNYNKLISFANEVL